MEAKENLLMKIEEAAIWRTERAHKYPDDKRNLDSSQALMELYEFVKKLSEKGPLFIYDPINDPIMNEIEYENLNNRLNRYGFDGVENPAEFIEELITSRLLSGFYHHFDMN